MSAHIRWAAALAAGALIAGLPTSANAGNRTDPAKRGPLTPILQAYAVGQLPPSDSADRMADQGTAGSVVTRPNGRLLVEVRLAETSQASLDRIRDAGGHIRVVDHSLRTLTVAIDPQRLPDLASLDPLVESVQEVLAPLTNLQCPPIGTAISEGVAQLKADAARSNVAVDGSDVVVGVISDSFNRLGGQNTDVLADDLPGTANPCGHSTNVLNLGEGPMEGKDEGRAMAQIVHDVAPGAHILFESGGYGQVDMARAIRDLANNGADIIVDDVTYFGEPMYQDGPIAQAVADVTAQGVVYFSSAANSNYIQYGNNRGSYEAPALRPTNCPPALDLNYLTPVQCHDFGDVSADPEYNIEIKPGGRVRYSLSWSEPMYGVSTDLDLCILDDTGSALACDKTNEVTTQVPTSYTDWENTTGSVASVSLAIVRYSTVGTPRFKIVSNRSTLTFVEPVSTSSGEVVGPTIYGHNASRPGVTVAAVPFDDSSVIEPYSSWGPATYCWGPLNGTTPAAPLVPCQTATVDVAATDGGKNSFFGNNNRFYGTSAAAPHAASVAALLLERQPCWTPSQVITALKSAGRPIGTLPTNAVGGGLIDATVALASTAGPKCDTTPPAVSLATPQTWFASSPATIPVAAQDRRTITSISCDNGVVQGLNGIGTKSAQGSVRFEGQGLRTITCRGTDFEGNTGAAPGSPNTVKVGIDLIGPTLKCRPATLSLGQPGAVVADMTDPHSGPAAATAVAAFIPKKAGSFLAKVTGSDKVGNATTVTCPYKVKSSVAISGKTKVKVKLKTKYVARGLPPHAPVQWTSRSGGDVVLTRKDKTNAKGEASTKMSFATKGTYIVRITAGKKSAMLKITVQG